MEICILQTNNRSGSSGCLELYSIDDRKLDEHWNESTEITEKWNFSGWFRFLVDEMTFFFINEHNCQVLSSPNHYRFKWPKKIKSTKRLTENYKNNPCFPKSIQNLWPKFAHLAVFGRFWSISALLSHFRSSV